MAVVIPTVPAGAAVILLVSAYLVYQIAIAIQRLYFHRLAGFPGPKIAAATGWYEFYYDWWLNGKYLFQIEQMHKKYGPIVRINPEEVSIHDPEFYNQIYATENKRRTNHYDAFCKGIDFEGSHFLTIDHDLHRKRRKPLEPFFSRQGVTRLQPMLAEVALRLESRLRALKGTGKVVRLDHVFCAFSGDIISRLCLDNEEGKRFLDDPDFSPEWYNILHTVITSLPFFTAFPQIIRVVTLVPESVLLWAFPQGQMFNSFREKAQKHIQRAMRNDMFEGENQTSLFHHIVHNSDMPESERSEARLTTEAQLLLGGGTATTARTIDFATYYILARPEIRLRLEAELKEPMAAWPDKVPSWTELESLTFLQAIIKESLRLSYGIMHRLPRVFPDNPVVYKQYTIPAGVPIGMSSYLMHSDPAVYPSPEEFQPDRWIGKINPQMDRQFVPFSRGSRNCLGSNLAMAELSLVLAVLYRPQGPKMELFETDESDVKQVCDYGVPLPKVTSKGIRVLVV